MALQQRDLLDIVRQRVRAGQLRYLGACAGYNMACPSLRTTNDMPIVQPATLDALSLVPFQINAHYHSGSHWVKVDGELREHFGETRDDRLREFHEMNDTPVVGLWEAGLLRVENGEVRLLGAPARVFRKGREAVDMEPGARLDDLLAGPGGER